MTGKRKGRVTKAQAAGVVVVRGRKDGTRAFNKNCTACTHEHVHDINEALVGGMSLRAVGAAYGVHYQQLHNHFHKHVLNGKRYDQGLVVISMQDIMKIPMVMKERRELQDALVDKLLTPLYNGQDITAVQIPALLGIWKLQMQDEQVILRIGGILVDGAVTAPVTPEAFESVRKQIETTLRGMADSSGPLRAAEARAALAAGFVQREGLPTSREADDRNVERELDKALQWEVLEDE